MKLREDKSKLLEIDNDIYYILRGIVYHLKNDEEDGNPKLFKNATLDKEDFCHYFSEVFGGEGDGEELHITYDESSEDMWIYLEDRYHVVTLYEGDRMEVGRGSSKYTYGDISRMVKQYFEED